MINEGKRFIDLWKLSRTESWADVEKLRLRFEYLISRSSNTVARYSCQC